MIEIKITNFSADKNRESYILGYQESCPSITLIHTYTHKGTSESALLILF